MVHKIKSSKIKNDNGPKFKEGDRVKVTTGKVFNDSSDIIIKSFEKLKTGRNTYYQYQIMPIANAYEFAWVWEGELVLIDPKINEVKKRLGIL